MRKLILLFVLLLTAAFVNAQDVNFNLSMTVEKYIEVTPVAIDWNVGTTYHDNGRATEVIYGNFNEWDLAYANCGFNITINGSNDAGEPYPRFAREETGANGGDYDILPTLYNIHIVTNGVSNHVAGDGTMTQKAGSFPLSEDFNEAPHNGQIKMNMNVFVNAALASDSVPVRETRINSAYTNIQSADAGLYECTMVVTLTAL